MLDLIRRVTVGRTKAQPENFSSGDIVEVHAKIVEGDKERVQKFRGTVTKLQGAGLSRTFTVRKSSAGVGVERTWPLASPMIAKIDVVSKGTVRRSKLYYLRKLAGKAARIEQEIATQEEKATT